MVLTRISQMMMIFLGNTSAAITWQRVRSWYIAFCNSVIYRVARFHLVLVAVASLDIVKLPFFRLAIFSFAFAVCSESTVAFSICPLVFCLDCFSVFGSAILRQLHNATFSAHILMSIWRCFPFVEFGQWQQLTGSFTFWIGAILARFIKGSFGSRRVRGTIDTHEKFTFLVSSRGLFQQLPGDSIGVTT